MPFDQENKREFERFSVSLNAEVRSQDGLTNNQSETTVLMDISGGGARFVTAYPERYSIGDKVDLIIQLPGGDALNANMTGVAKVAWMGELEEGKTSIGLCMDDLLVFESMVNKNS